MLSSYCETNKKNKIKIEWHRRYHIAIPRYSLDWLRLMLHTSLLYAFISTFITTCLHYKHTPHMCSFALWSPTAQCTILLLDRSIIFGHNAPRCQCSLFCVHNIHTHSKRHMKIQGEKQQQRIQNIQ